MFTRQRVIHISCAIACMMVTDVSAYRDRMMTMHRLATAADHILSVQFVSEHIRNNHDDKGSCDKILV